MNNHTQTVSAEGTASSVGHNLSTGAEARGQRSLDLMIASLMIVITSPLLLIHSVCALLTQGRILASVETAENNLPARFASRLPTIELAALFSVLTGRYTFAAQSNDHTGRKGLFTARQLRERLGVT